MTGDETPSERRSHLQRIDQNFTFAIALMQHTTAMKLNRVS
ncbi:hypothetical protein [Tardiphaga sp.]|nr:hypothetical protein [Tardiphaga sp.]